jgi:hypothetical protein
VSLPLMSLSWLAFLWWTKTSVFYLGGLRLSRSASRITACVGSLAPLAPILLVVLFLDRRAFDEVIYKSGGLTPMIFFIAALLYPVLLFGFRLLFWLCTAAQLREVYGPLPPAILDEDTCRKFLTAPH